MAVGRRVSPGAPLAAVIASRPYLASAFYQPRCAKPNPVRQTRLAKPRDSEREVRAARTCPLTRLKSSQVAAATRVGMRHGERNGDNTNSTLSVASSHHRRRFGALGSKTSLYTSDLSLCERSRVYHRARALCRLSLARSLHYNPAPTPPSPLRRCEVPVHSP